MSPVFLILRIMPAALLSFIFSFVLFSLQPPDQSLTCVDCGLTAHNTGTELDRCHFRGMVQDCFIFILREGHTGVDFPSCLIPLPPKKWFLSRPNPGLFLNLPVLAQFAVGENVLLHVHDFYVLLRGWARTKAVSANMFELFLVIIVIWTDLLVTPWLMILADSLSLGEKTLVPGFIRDFTAIWLSRATSDTFWGNMVLLKKGWSRPVVSGCGLRAARSPLYSNSLPSFSLSPRCFLSPSQIGATTGEHWHFLFFFRGLCDIFTTAIWFSPRCIFTFVSASIRRMEGDGEGLTR